MACFRICPRILSWRNQWKHGQDSRDSDRHQGMYIRTNVSAAAWSFQLSSFVTGGEVLAQVRSAEFFLISKIPFTLMFMFHCYNGVSLSLYSYALSRVLLPIPRACMSSMEQRWNDNDRGKPTDSEKSLSHCQSVQQKSHMDCPGSETGPARKKTGN
jgi:hypothetical protein